MEILIYDRFFTNFFSYRYTRWGGGSVSLYNVESEYHKKTLLEGYVIVSKKRKKKKKEYISQNPKGHESIPDVRLRSCESSEKRGW